MASHTPLPLADALARQFARPSWADPSFMLAANVFAASSVALVMNVPTLIASSDPKRWILTIIRPSATLAPLAIYPNGANPNIGIGLGTISPIFRMSIFEYGPIVSYDWYALSSTNVTVDVWSTQIGPKDSNV